MSKINNPEHLEILKQLKQFGGEPTLVGFDVKYVGTKRPSYHLKTAIQKQIIKTILKSHPFDLTNFVDLVNSLYQNGTSYDEIIIAGRIVGARPLLRSQLQPSLLNNWLNYTQGWAEVDTLCQLSYTPDEFLNKWDQWRDLLVKFNSDLNVHKRRASLVLLTKPVSHSPDTRLSDLAFENCDHLKSEKDILISKAVSWILRSLIRYHKDEVAKYLENNKDSLPKIAYREATTKLLTGKKYVRK